MLNDNALLVHLTDGFPPRNTKLAPHIWRQAAQHYAASNGRITLRTLCEECCVSHRTAWRIREALRDSEQRLQELRFHNAGHSSHSPSHCYQGENS